MKIESGESYYNPEHFEDIPEIEEGLVDAWKPPKPQKIDFHRDIRIQQDVYVEELQDRADELRMNPDWMPEPIHHENSASWLNMLREKLWKKKNS